MIIIIIIAVSFLLCSKLNAQVSIAPIFTIEGYSDGLGGPDMTPVKYDQGCSGWVNTKTTSCRVRLRGASSPHNVIATSSTGVLPTNGVAYGLSFSSISPSSVVGYYIELLTDDGLPLWSSNLVTFPTSSAIIYDFTTSLSSAYSTVGNQQKDLYNNASYFAMYSGDLVRTDTIDQADQDEMDTQIMNYASGCAARGDLNGDGNTDLIDDAILSPNIGRWVQRP